MLQEEETEWDPAAPTEWINEPKASTQGTAAMAAMRYGYTRSMALGKGVRVMVASAPHAQGIRGSEYSSQTDSEVEGSSHRCTCSSSDCDLDNFGQTAGNSFK
jgi:hypothetical protein